MRVFRLLLFSVLWRAAGLARAEVTPAPLFGDHAVLQRGKPIPIWGRAEAGEKITVTFLDQRVGTTAGADGRWMVLLDAIEARSEGGDLLIQGKNTITLHDVVVGEVWIFVGTSHFEQPAAPLQNPIAVPLIGPSPGLRLLSIEPGAADLPADSVRHRGWQGAPPPDSVEAGTTAGIFFARDVFQKIGVPVGLVQISSSAPIDAWLSPATFAREPSAAAASAQRKLRSANTSTDAMRTEPIAPSALFNGAINPLIPYAIRGILWQESLSGAADSEGYRSLFPAMITAWREHFGQGDFPFYWVQMPAARVASDARSTSLAFFRAAQAAALALPNTGEAVAIDLGDDPTSSGVFASETIGRRLARLARNRVYGIVADDAGPAFVSATPEGPALRVRLAHTASGLVAHEKPVQSLELAGADKVFRAATGRIERETLLVSSPEVRVPVAVRYAWRNAPDANLYNGAGLPAAPFRSDDW